MRLRSSTVINNDLYYPPCGHKDTVLKKYTLVLVNTGFKDWLKHLGHRIYNSTPWRQHSNDPYPDPPQNILIFYDHLMRYDDDDGIQSNRDSQKLEIVVRFRLFTTKTKLTFLWIS